MDLRKRLGENQGMSLMELGRRVHAGEITLEDALREMKEGSCSVTLSWSEDDRDQWECSWIVGGVRYTAYHFQPRSAVLSAIVKCTTALVSAVPHLPCPACEPGTVGEHTDGCRALSEF